jgi:PhnB protein
MRSDDPPLRSGAQARSLKPENPTGPSPGDITMTATLCPYLNFDGKTADAMKFYQSVLGGKLTVQTYADAFPDTPPAMKDRVMHAHLENDALSFMASDTNPQHDPRFVPGNNISLSIVGNDSAKLTEYFNGLAEGGTIVMPLEKQFWGDVFGMLTDKFGIQWMVNISA